MNASLYEKSIKIILKNQAPIGAYVASPNFASYQYCWIRDGSYIAYAMDLAEHHTSADSFHHWVTGVVLDRKDLIESSSRKNPSELVAAGDYLHTRFMMDGREAQEDWPNFQLDGYGTWLWALAQHLSISGNPPEQSCLNAARLVAQYLAAFWKTPCYDLWEEHPHNVHPYTLASIYGGLNGISSLIHCDFNRELGSIRQFILDRYCTDHIIRKFTHDDLVDASLVGLAVPYHLFSPVDPIIQNTIAEIERQLICGGGVHRYREDSYYGGGEWLLLSAWLGWYYCEVGETGKARRMLEWIERQADENQNLPEQVPQSLNYPEMYPPWEKRWGKIANPLLWSHAKYIILSQLLNHRQ